MPSKDKLAQQLANRRQVALVTGDQALYNSVSQAEWELLNSGDYEDFSNSDIDEDA